MPAREHPTLTPPAPADGLYVVGIDTSLTATGIAHLGARTGATTTGQAGITTLKIDQRIPAVYAMAIAIAARAASRRKGDHPLPQLALIESPDTSRSRGGLVERVYLTCRVTESLMSMGVPVGWVPSAVIKGYCIGKGGGKIDGVPAKQAVKLEAMRLWPENEIEDDNQADATVLAAMALDMLTGERRVPDAHADEWLRRSSIEWPALPVRDI